MACLPRAWWTPQAVDAEYFEFVLRSLAAPLSSVLLWEDSERIVAEARSLGLHAELFGDTTAFVETMCGCFPHV
jgi:hypothetical protein